MDADESHTPGAEHTTERTAEGRALMASIDGVAPDARTACPDWRAHELVAHLAAGAKERADLVEEKLAGEPDRPTQPFTEREAAFRELPDAELRRALVVQRARAEHAVRALGERGQTIRFTGREFSPEQLTTHMRSEAVLHRWDLIGTDSTGAELMAQPELTSHAVDILSTLPLAESPRARAQSVGVRGLRIALRVAGEPDVLYFADPDEGRCEITDTGHAAEVTMTMDAAARLLSVWGRWPARPITVVAGHIGDLRAAASVLWPQPPG